MSGASAGTRVNSVSPDEVAEVQDGCQTVVECAVGDTLSSLLLLLVFVVGVVVPIAVLAFVHLRDAVSALREERTEAAAEANAYSAFVRRVARMDPEPAGSTTASDGGTVARSGTAHRSAMVQGGAAPGLDGVVDAYRETVMAEAGMGSADDREVLADMAEELGGDLAGTVRRSERLTPQIRSALIRSGRSAATRREDLVDAVDREIEDVNDARSTFEDVAQRAGEVTGGGLDGRTYDELQGTWRTVRDLEERVETRLRDRQERIHDEPFNRAGTPDDDPAALQSYLYEPVDVRFPVLADGTELVSRLRSARRRVESAIASR